MSSKSPPHPKILPNGNIRSVADIGAAIRAKRKAVGMRQEQLAALVGVGPRFLSEVENGKESAAIGKVLQVLLRLGLDVSIKPRGASEGQ